jgi:hypothetical protein
MGLLILPRDIVVGAREFTRQICVAREVTIIRGAVSPITCRCWSQARRTGAVESAGVR